MPTLSLLPRLVAAIGGLALSVSAAAGVAAANPDVGTVVNTTCTYPQAVAALNAQDPAAAEKFNSSPMAQGFLSSFLAAPPDERQEMVEQPAVQPFLGPMIQAAGICNNY